MSKRLSSFLISLLAINSLFLSLAPASVLAAATEIEWVRQLGGVGGVDDLLQTVDIAGHIYIAGTTEGTLPGQTSAGSRDVFLLKYDAGAGVVWIRQFGSEGADDVVSIAADSGGVYVTGAVEGALPGETSSGNWDGYLRKYDTDGNIVWTRQFGSEAYDSGSGLSLDATGAYIGGLTAAALPDQTSSGNFDAFLRKYDASGNILWTRQFGTSAYDDIWKVEVNATGVYGVGNTLGTLEGQVSSGDKDIILVKYDTAGNNLWSRQYGSAGADDAFGVMLDATSIYTSGVVRGDMGGQAAIGNGDGFIQKHDTAGNAVWTRIFGTSAYDEANSMASDSGGIYAAGVTGGTLPGQTSSGNQDAYVQKYDTSGNMLWSQQFGTSADDSALAVVVGTAGVFVGGQTSGTFPGQTSSGAVDAFVAKIYRDSDDDGMSDGVDTNATLASTSFSDGTSFGVIVTTGDQTLRIADASNPAQGILIKAMPGGGNARARVSGCGVSTYNLRAGESVVVTCGSATVDVVAGQVLSEFTGDDGTVVTSDINQGNSLTFQPEDTSFTASASNPEPVVLDIEGAIVTLEPGEELQGVAIDIKPSNQNNCVAIAGQGAFAVAVLGDSELDVTQVKSASLRLNGLSPKIGGIGQIQTGYKDANGDGFTDLIVHFDRKTGPISATEKGNLLGSLNDGTSIFGSDVLCGI